MISGKTSKHFRRIALLNQFHKINKMKMLLVGCNVHPCKKTGIHIKINFTNYLHKLLSKAIRVLTDDSLVGSYRLFQAYSYLQCPFLTLALWKWSVKVKTTDVSSFKLQQEKKLWRCAWPRVCWQLRREKPRNQELKRNLNAIHNIFTPTQNSHEND